MRKHAFVTTLLGLLASLPALGQPSVTGVGTLEAHGIGRAGGAAVRLRLSSVLVDATPAGDEAETRVEHLFENAGDDRLEGTFRFLLPDGARLIGLALEVNGKLEEGSLVEREEARRIFQTVVDQMRDPALMEWDGGAAVQLRVFPIEPSSTKRVVVRFLSPLSREVDGWRYSYPLSIPEGEDPRVVVRFGGRVLVDAASGKTAGLASVSHVLPGTLAPPPVGRETRDGLTYLSFRVTPSWAKVPARILSGPARLLVLVDTSRSALESRPVVLASLHALLSGLPSDASFALVAADITCRDYASDFVPATPGAADAAVRFLRGIEADGATDLGALIRHAGTLVARLSEAEREKVRIVYLGDGVATWGVTDPKDLTALAAQHLGGLPFHALAFGKSPDRLLRELSAPSGGSVTAPRTLSDVTRFGTLVTAPRLRFLRGVSLKTPMGTEARLRATDAIVDGEPVEAVVALAKDEPLPSSVVVSAESQAGPYLETLALPAPVDVPHVAKRWAALEIARLEERGAASKDEIVELSTSFGVLSKYTAFLVLENERMYRDFGLKRRRPADATDADATPKVTGKDLESTGGDEPTLSPDRVQPGDPEIRIPAPADARAVTVVFPFGETKSATYDEAISAWTVRFLIPPGTPDGRYEVAIRITRRDDLVEILRLSYVVDTLAPSVNVTLRPSATASGAYELEATQVITEAELSAAGDPTGLEPTGVNATIVSDMRRVEVTLPGGRVVTLAPAGNGVFRAVFTPAKALASPLKVTVTAFDRAQNVSRFDVVLAPSAAPVPGGTAMTRAPSRDR